MSDEYHAQKLTEQLLPALTAQADKLGYVLVSRAQYDALITERDKLKSEVEQLLGAMKLDGRFLAQYDALMAAAKDIKGLESHFDKPKTRSEPLLRIASVINTIKQRAAALRAAGIQTEEP